MQIKKGGYHEYLHTGRSAARGTNGAVASPHYLATQAGQEVIKKGGHAVEGAIAVNAVLCVVYPHMAGLGGDLFALLWNQEEEDVKALNGSGRSGAKATREYYQKKGHTQIPERGPLSANTVPGTVDAWWEMHQHYGKLQWSELFQAAISYAENGFPITEKFSTFIHEKQEVLEKSPEASKVFLPNGQPLKSGTVLKQPDLAWSLKQIAENGRKAFYEGEIAEKLVNSLQKQEGLVSMEDLQQHHSDWESPISTDYRGYQVHELKPNTQGIAALMMMNILNSKDLSEIGDNTPEYYHLLTEAAKLSFYYRDEWVTDKAFKDIPMEELLSGEHTSKLLGKITSEEAYSLDHLKNLPQLSTNKDTTYMSVVDAEGNCVSLIQSIYHEFGSGFMPEECGFLLQNRGSFFSLDENHPNRLEPGKRTFHTIIPAMATKDGKPFLLFGSMGGEGQPQTQCALLTRIVDFGYDVQQAIEAPRWLFGRTWGDSSSSLKLENRIPDSVADILRSKGHEVEIVEAYSQTMGHAQAIHIDQETGVLTSGADPRGDGIALAW
ncbi:gamma-glutamyltransferase [Bacillus lacus]|uniref:Glutathione hydrolase proenzyme n=1 Tax=Metabacillus lacus TaxID=1983721 RepID=A0A7X2J2L1_9BACI|nr:gamma-glutamyltransferase [Metabacillus lacus]MRX74169.1 gamma-glutamyltransferase [Metabacillus lacus]